MYLKGCVLIYVIMCIIEKVFRYEETDLPIKDERKLSELGQTKQNKTKQNKTDPLKSKQNVLIEKDIGIQRDQNGPFKEK